MNIKNIHIFVKVFIVIISTLFTTINTFSQNLLPNGSFLISEINWDGGWIWDDILKTYKSNSTDEWFELYNQSDQDVNLAQFSVMGFSIGGKELSLKYPEKCVIKPKSYLIVARLEDSPTLGKTDCVGSNMSISNTNISISITNKIDIQQKTDVNIGDPSKIFKEDKGTIKHSIINNNNTWVKSTDKININPIKNGNNEYLHFASPGGVNSDLDLKVEELQEFQSLPVSKELILISKSNQNEWVADNISYSVYDKDCINKKTDLVDNVWTIELEGEYCLSIQADIKNINSNSKFSFVSIKNTNIKTTNSIIPTTPTQPQDVPKIYINEIDLNSDTVELNSDDDFDWELKDFCLQDTIGSIKKIELGDFLIKSKSYMVINVKDIGIALNNNGDNLILSYKNSILNQSTAPLKYLTKDYSYQYFYDTQTWESFSSTMGSLNQRIATIPDINPNKTNATEEDETTIKSNTLEYFKNKIRLNEVYPEGDESIELYNNSDEDIDIIGLDISDISGKTSKYTISTNLIIRSKTYIKIETKKYFNLNNSGDGVQLKTSQGDLIDKVEYDKSKGVELSYQYFDDGWVWEEPTLSNENVKQISIEKNTTEEEKENIPTENCSETIIYAQTSKNIFQNNEFRFEIKNSNKINFPARVNICDINFSGNIIKAKNMILLEKIYTINLKKSLLTDTIKPNNNTITDFNLDCSGKKTVKLSVQNLIIKKTYGSDIKTECFKNKISGVGYFVKQTNTDKDILYITSVNNKNPVVGSTSAIKKIQIMNKIKPAAPLEFQLKNESYLKIILDYIEQIKLNEILKKVQDNISIVN